jgi:hypothetical protein
VQARVPGMRCAACRVCDHSPRLPSRVPYLPSVLQPQPRLLGGAACGPFLSYAGSTFVAALQLRSGHSVAFNSTGHLRAGHSLAYVAWSDLDSAPGIQRHATR